MTHVASSILHFYRNNAFYQHSVPLTCSPSTQHTHLSIFAFDNTFYRSGRYSLGYWCFIAVFYARLVQYSKRKHLYFLRYYFNFLVFSFRRLLFLFKICPCKKRHRLFRVFNFILCFNVSKNSERFTKFFRVLISDFPYFICHVCSWIILSWIWSTFCCGNTCTKTDVAALYCNILFCILFLLPIADVLFAATIEPKRRPNWTSLSAIVFGLK